MQKHKWLGRRVQCDVALAAWRVQCDVALAAWRVQCDVTVAVISTTLGSTKDCMKIESDSWNKVPGKVPHRNTYPASLPLTVRKTHQNITSISSFYRSMSMATLPSQCQGAQSCIVLYCLFIGYNAKTLSRVYRYNYKRDQYLHRWCPYIILYSTHTCTYQYMTMVHTHAHISVQLQYTHMHISVYDYSTHTCTHQYMTTVYTHAHISIWLQYTHMHLSVYDYSTHTCTYQYMTTVHTQFMHLSVCDYSTHTHQYMTTAHGTWQYMLVGSYGTLVCEGIFIWYSYVTGSFFHFVLYMSILLLAAGCWDH